MRDKGAVLDNRYWERGLVPAGFCDDLFDLQVLFVCSISFHGM